MTHSRLVTPRLNMLKCRATHPTSRLQCTNGSYGHDLHWSDGTAGRMWATDTGKTFTPVGEVYVTYFGRFVPLPGHEADETVEHFPDEIILRHEVATRITHRYGTSFAPGDHGRTVRYNEVSAQAYMDVWVIVSTDHRVHDPVPEPCTTRPVERWYTVRDLESCRSEYLPVVAA